MSSHSDFPLSSSSCSWQYEAGVSMSSTECHDNTGTTYVLRCICNYASCALKQTRLNIRSPSHAQRQSIRCRLGLLLGNLPNSLLQCCRNALWAAPVLSQLPAPVGLLPLSCTPDARQQAQPLAATESLLHVPNTDEQV